MINLDRLAVTRRTPRDNAPLRRLAAAVLLQAVQDAAGRGQTRADARQFLFDDAGALGFWCHVAGVAPDRVRRAVESGAKPRVCRAEIERAVRDHPELNNSEIGRRLGCHRERVRVVRLAKMGAKS